MYFIDVLKKVNPKDVVQYIFENHTDERKYVEGYYTLISQLLEKTPIYNDDFIIVVALQKDFFDKEEYIDVSGYDKNSDVSYALEFTEREKWLGFTVSEKSLEYFGEVAFVAECLMEMSFISLDEERVKAEIDNLNAISARIESGEEKLIPFEEAMKELHETLGEDYVVREVSDEERADERKEFEEISEWNKTEFEKFVK